MKGNGVAWRKGTKGKGWTLEEYKGGNDDNIGMAKERKGNGFFFLMVKQKKKKGFNID